MDGFDKMNDNTGWQKLANERDEDGNLTDMALAVDAINNTECDCRTDEHEPGTCLRCLCKTALMTERAEAILSGERNNVATSSEKIITRLRNSIVSAKSKEQIKEHADQHYQSIVWNLCEDRDFEIRKITNKFHEECSEKVKIAYDEFQKILSENSD